MNLQKRMGLTALFLFFNLLCLNSFAQTGSHAIMRVFDCNKAIGMGGGFLSAKILIVYEDSNIEEIELLPYTEKNEVENLKKINEALNAMRKKGYKLVSQALTGEQGSLVMDYSFVKE